MIDETVHPHWPQLQQCREQFVTINAALNGDSAYAGIKTNIATMNVHLENLTEQVKGLHKQGASQAIEMKRQTNIVQRLIWIGFGALAAINLFFKSEPGGNVLESFFKLFGKILGSVG